jgi:putative copper export protein
MTDQILEITKFLISFIHIISASAWFAGSLISLNINHLVKINEGFSLISKQFIDWTNIIISSLVMTGVILILNNLAQINDNSMFYIGVLLVKLFLFIWIMLIIYLSRFKTIYLNKTTIYHKIFKLVLQSKLIFPMTIIIFLLSELLNLIRI